MKDTALFTQLLGISSPWQVTKVSPEFDDKSISINIDWPKGEQGICPECGVLCPVYDHREERTWRHLDTMQFKTLLVCHVPRVNCNIHGIKSMQVPWADMNSHFTMLFERFAIDILLATTNQTKAAKLLDLSWDEVHHIQERAVNRGIKRRNFADTVHLGIDEKSFLKGQSYVSVLYDLDQSRVLEVVKERTQEAAVSLCSTLQGANENITAVAMDMWKPYISAVTEVMPKAEIVHDKYHIMSYLNKAVDEVRRNENKVLQKQGNKVLNGTRYTWLRNINNWTEKDQQTFKSLQNENLKVGKAWSIKETFINLWNYSYTGAARKFFAEWYFWATHSHLKPVIKVAKLIKNHLDNILTYLHYKITNATAEGLNSKIQTIKAAARGFRNFDNYRIAILFYCGRMEVYP